MSLPQRSRKRSSYLRGRISVGYFNLRGWRGLSESVDAFRGGDGHQCRVLVAMQCGSDDEVHARYSLAHDEQSDQQEVVRLKRRFVDSIRSQLIIGAPTNADESGLRILRKQLLQGEVTVRLFLRHSPHAKLYLAYREDAVNPITGFLGSSSLTAAGLRKQGELNVDVLDHDACEKLQRWFEERWSESSLVEPVVEELLRYAGRPLKR